MSTSDHDRLYEHMQSVRETVKDYARQIESGEYESTWMISATEDDRPIVSVLATSEDEAISAGEDVTRPYPAGGVYAELDSTAADEPTHDETPISEYPLEIVDERGREFAVVICTGGPHIEIVADGGSSARLEGYWAGERCTMSGDIFTTVLDYFIERD